jgi:hypothetical protein
MKCATSCIRGDRASNAHTPCLSADDHYLLYTAYGRDNVQDCAHSLGCLPQVAAVDQCLAAASQFNAGRDRVRLSAFVARPAQRESAPPFGLSYHHITRPAQCYELVTVSEIKSAQYALQSDIEPAIKQHIASIEAELAQMQRQLDAKRAKVRLPSINGCC